MQQIKEWLKNLVSTVDRNELEEFIRYKNPKSIADVEYWTKYYEHTKNVFDNGYAGPHKGQHRS